MVSRAASRSTAPSARTGGRGESGFRPAIVETCRIVNVNVNDYTVDVVSEYGNGRHYDIQVMSPYFHYSNGEGWYAMPEVGALCWVCKESPGMFSRRFILGYQAPHDERKLEGADTEAGNFKANRQTLNPGDQMWRGRDENFVILRRGGVVQIGASPANQRIYIPIGSIIRDFCFGYELETLSGDLGFFNDSVQVQGTEVSQADDAGNTKTRFRVRAKTRASDPGHAVTMTFGSHEDDENLRLSLQVNESGQTGAAMVANLLVDKEGTVVWTMEKDFTLSANGNMSLAAETGDLLVKATAGAATFKASKDVIVQSETGKMTVQSAGDALVKGRNVTVEGAVNAYKGKNQLGGPGGEPIPKGLQLKAFFELLIDGLTNPAAPAGPAAPPVGFPMLFPGLIPLKAQLNAILSTNNTTT